MSADIVPFPLTRRTQLVTDYVVGREAAHWRSEWERAVYETKQYRRMEKSLIKLGIDPERARRECVAFENFAWSLTARALKHAKL